MKKETKANQPQNYKTVNVLFTPETAKKVDLVEGYKELVTSYNEALLVIDSLNNDSAKRIQSLDNTIRALRNDKASLHEQLSTSRDACESHGEELKYLYNSNKKTITELQNSAKLNDEYSIIIRDMKYDIDKLQAEIATFKASTFTLAKFWQGIKSPFISAYNKLKGLWA